MSTAPLSRRSAVWPNSASHGYWPFHIYVTDDESSQVVVQVHPDAESMQHHLQEFGEKVRATAGFGDFESLEIYGELNDALRQWLPRH